SCVLLSAVSAIHALVCSLCLFCFYSSGDARDLHSFPTRRSSDLRGAVAAPQPLRHLHLGPRRRDDRDRVRRGRAARAAVTRDLRSEEHTSELQSRENLVCRLLLEKKKLISTYAMKIT